MSDINPTHRRERSNTRHVFALLTTGLLVGACSTLPTTPEGTTAGTDSAPVAHRGPGRLDAALAELTITSDGRLRPTRKWAEDPATAARLLREGAQHDEKGDWVDAVDAYARAIVAAPTDASTFAALGLALADTKRTNEARAALRTALHLDPDRTLVRFRLGTLLQAVGDEAGALDQLEIVVRTEPDHGLAHERLSVLYHFAERPDRARHHLDEAQRLGVSIAPTLRQILDEGAPITARTITGSTAALQTKSGGGFVGPQVRVDNSGTRRVEEPSASGGPFNDQHLVAAWHDYPTPTSLRIMGGISSDQGATWSRHVLRPLGKNEAQGDPMTATDPRTGNQWVGGLAFGTTSQSAPDEFFVARRQPGASSFDTAVTLATFGQLLDLDKGFMVAGRKHDVNGVNNANTTRLYATVKRFNNARDLLYFSDDFGVTWNDDNPREFSPPLTGLLPRIGPVGELYIFGADDQSPRMQVLRNFDNGEGPLVWNIIQNRNRLATWDSSIDFPGIPGDFRVPHFAYMAVDPNAGDLYVVYFDQTATVAGEKDIDLYMMKSSDQGVTWSQQILILDDDGGAANPVGDQFFPWIEVDDRGRLHLVYWDSSNTTQNDSDGVGWFDVYYAVSSDQGDTWTRFRLTPNSFSTANVFQQILQSDFVGDYIGMAVTGDVAHPVYVSTQNGNLDVFTNAIDFGPEPVARNDYYYTPRDFPVIIGHSDPLLNDDNLTSGIVVCSVTQPAQGSVTEVHDGFRYAPPIGFTGVETFEYTACGPAGSATATIQVEVFPGSVTWIDDFEDGLEVFWAPITANSGTVGADPAAALQRGQGLRPAVTGVGDHGYVQVDVGSLTRIESAFHLDPQNMATGAFEKHVLFEGRGGNDWLFEIQVGRNGQGIPRVRARIKDAAGNVTTSSWTLIERPVSIKVVWQANQLPNPTGGVQLIVDGQSVAQLLSDRGQSLARLRLGAVRNVPMNTSGAHAIDSFVAATTLLL